VKILILTPLYKIVDHCLIFCLSSLVYVCFFRNKKKVVFFSEVSENLVDLTRNDPIIIYYNTSNNNNISHYRMLSNTVHTFERLIPTPSIQRSRSFISKCFDMFISLSYIFVVCTEV